MEGLLGLTSEGENRKNNTVIVFAAKGEKLAHLNI